MQKTVEELYADMSVRVSELQQQNEVLKKENSAISEKIKSFSDDLSKLTKDKERLQDEVIALEAKKKKLIEQGDTAELELIDLQKQASRAKEDKEIFAEELERVKVDVKNLINKSVEVKMQLKVDQGTLENNFKTLRDYEEQLNTKEAILKRREEKLDLRDKLK